MNKRERLEAALGAVDQELLAEILEADAQVAAGTAAERSKGKLHERKRKWRIGMTAAAACLVFVVGVAAFGGGLTGDGAREPQADGQLSLYINELGGVGVGDLDVKEGERIDMQPGEGMIAEKKLDAESKGGLVDQFVEYSGMEWTEFLDRLPEHYLLQSFYTLYTRTLHEDDPKKGGDYDVLHDYVFVFTIGEDDDPADGIEQNTVHLSLSAVGKPLRDYFFGDETQLRPSQAGGMTFTVSHWAGDAQKEYSDYIITFEEGKLSYDVEMCGVTESDVEALIAAFAGVEIER